RRKGISASALPYKRSPPTWLKTTALDVRKILRLLILFDSLSLLFSIRTRALVDESICKFAKKGLTPSQIGVIICDSHGIPQLKSVTGKSETRSCVFSKLTVCIPEDLYHLLKKAVAVRKHLERNRK
ncbi:unnamed protein product, partial [Brassica rapa subsp. trilocularis]